MTTFSLNDHIPMIPKWNDPNDRPAFIALIGLIAILLILMSSCSDVVAPPSYQSKYAKHNSAQFQRAKY